MYDWNGVDGALLMGGRGTRMGGCRKEQLMMDSRPFYEIAADALSDCDRLFLSVNDDAFPSSAAPLSVREHSQLHTGEQLHTGAGARSPRSGAELLAEARSVRDVYPDTGPLSGVYSVMRQSTAEFLFVLACDMPLVTHEFVNALISQGVKSSGPYAENSGRWDAIVPVTSAGSHPLCGLYRTSLADLFLMHIKQGRRSVKGLLDRIPTLYIDVEQLGFAPSALVNINVPDVYENLARLRRTAK